MVAALREAQATGKAVGVLDIDVHFATGSQQIAMRWHEQKPPGAGRVLVADVYAAMGPPARFVESCLLYTSPSPRDRQKSRMPSSA